MTLGAAGYSKWRDESRKGQRLSGPDKMVGFTFYGGRRVYASDEAIESSVAIQECRWISPFAFGVCGHDMF